MSLRSDRGRWNTRGGKLSRSNLLRVPCAAVTFSAPSFLGIAREKISANRHEHCYQQVKPDTAYLTSHQATSLRCQTFFFSFQLEGHHYSGSRLPHLIRKKVIRLLDKHSPNSSSDLYYTFVFILISIMLTRFPLLTGLENIHLSGRKFPLLNKRDSRGLPWCKI